MALPTFVPTSSYSRHTGLEARVTKYLEENNYWIGTCTYHTVLPERVAQALSRRFSLTALYLRGGADWLAIHRAKPIEFEWEAKSHGPTGDDLLIEALPLVHHVQKARLGALVLYAFEVGDLEAGFWAHQLPELRAFYMVEDERYGPIKSRLLAMVKKFFPDVPVRWAKNNRLRDPFVVIDRGVIRGLPHWKTLIDNVR